MLRESEMAGQGRKWGKVLDTRTVMFLWCAEALTLASLLAVLWNSDRKATYNILWSTAFAAHGIGVLLVGLRNLIPDFVSIQIANTIALSAFAFWTWGLSSFDGKQDDRRGAIPALVWIAFMFVPPVRDDLYARQVLFQVASSIGFLLLVKLLLFTDRHVSTTRKMLAWLLIFQAVAGLIAAVTRPFFDYVRTDVVPASPFIAFSATLTFVATILLCTKMFMEKAHEKLHILSLTDPLTGVFNRRGLIGSFESMTRHQEKGVKVALILYDLDHFKQINDRHGHQAGDSVLCHFCRIADRLPAHAGTFARMGGEEFATIMRVSSVEDAAVLAENIRMNLSVRPAATATGVVPATVSIGIAAMPAADASFDWLMSQADRALYAAKVDGRNRTAIRYGENSIVVPCSHRAPDAGAMDNSADRQVAALNRLSSIARG